MASPQLVSQAIAFVSKWPQCIQSDLIKGFVASNCGPDLECVCENKIFGLVLVDGTRKNCDVPDAIATTDMLLDICPTLHENRKNIVIAVVAVTTALALASVIMRIASRRIAGTKLWVDDYLIMIAMVIGLGETANIAILIHAGLGKHFASLNVTQQVLWFKTFWILQFLYSWTMTLVKFAIIIFYHRVFNVKRSMRITVYVISVFLVLCFLAQVIYISVECQPIAKFWDYAMTTGHCNTVGTHIIGYAINGASLGLDLVLFVAAIPALWGLKRSLAGRMSLIGIFLVGGLVCIAGAVRMPVIVKMDLTDLPWSSIHAIVWLQIETKIGIVCACLPMLPPLFRLLSKSVKVPSFISRLHKSRKTSTSGHYLVTDKADQGAGSPVVATPRSAGSPVTAQFASSDRDDTKDWYAVAMRNLSVSVGEEHAQISEALDQEKQTPSNAV